MIQKPAFQLPFKCGQLWFASTYDGNYPDQDSLKELSTPPRGITTLHKVSGEVGGILCRSVC
jgi:hypothetical protein